MKNNKIQVIESFSDTLTISAPTSNAGIEVINSISNSVENTLGIGEGAQPRFSKIKVDLLVLGPAGDGVNFTIQPLVVQASSGSFADTVALTAPDKLQDHLNAAISDEFGFLRLGNVRFSKQRTEGSSTILRGYVRTSFALPPHLLSLVSKQANTERLQDLFFAFQIVGSEAATAITVTAFVTYEWTESHKGITIR